MCDGIISIFVTNSCFLQKHENFQVSFNVRATFVVSLACSDLLMTLTALPMTATMIFTRVWPFGHLLCHSASFLLTTSVCVSSFTLIVIAIDRFQLVLWPAANVLNPRRAKALIVAVWAMGLALASPPMPYVMLRVRIFCQRGPEWQIT